MALGMTMNGARGETLDEMRATLGFAGMSQEEINASYRDLIAMLLKLDGSVEMRIANALWVQEGFPLHAPFVAATRDSFGAEATELDLRDPASLGTINSWVDRSTNGRIRKILDEVDPDIVLYLMNAIYFKGTWTQQFDERQTQPAPFRRADGTQRTVQMMHLRQADVLAYGSPEVQVVDLPYGREAFSMTLVLPAEDRTLDSLVGSLDATQWQAWIDGLQPRKLDIFLPRFRLEYERTLNETLQALGMARLFQPHVADLTGISPARQDLYVGEVRQKTFLEVNEKGTEAAAVTSVGVMPTSLPPSFRADRPFLLVIRERLSGTILFLGAIGAPESA
jgi:serine protease inhibitor